MEILLAVAAVASPVIALAGIVLGWWLNGRSQRSMLDRTRREALEDRDYAERTQERDRQLTLLRTLRDAWVDVDSMEVQTTGYLVAERLRLITYEVRDADLRLALLAACDWLHVYRELEPSASNAVRRSQHVAFDLITPALLGEPAPADVLERAESLQADVLDANELRDERFAG